MSNLIETTVTIQGTRTLLWHAFGPHAIPLEKQERTGVAGNDPDEWRKTVLFDPATRHLFLPSIAVFSCLREAGKHTKRGRGTLMADVGATLQILDDQVFVDRSLPDEPTTDDTQPVYIHVASVRNPNTKGRNVRYRIATQPGWQATFTLLWDKTIVSRPQMEAVLQDAGRLVGLGDGRAIGYGRFVVTAFALVDDAGTPATTTRLAEAG
jgi:hypothetical protein